MPAYYLDTSALVKRYRAEQGTETVNELLDGRREDEVLITSYLGSLEVEAVAARLLRGNIISRRSYQRIIANHSEDIADRLTLYPIGNDTLREATVFIRRHALRAPDAVHLATARMVRDASGVLTIYTASDRTLLEAARHQGFQLLNPEEAESLERLRRYRGTL